MAILNKKFDVLRGWPNEGAIDEVWPVRIVSGNPVSLPLGTIVVPQADGSVDAGTTGNVSTTAPQQVWLVVDGNDDYSATFVGKVNCIKGNAVVRLDPANFVAGTYNVNTPLSFNAGKFKPAATNEQVIGHVMTDDRNLDGTLRIFYSGGISAAI